MVLKYIVEVVWGSHLEIPPFPQYPAIILRYAPDYLEG
jgi:hypothetical protein